MAAEQINSYDSEEIKHKQRPRRMRFNRQKVCLTGCGTCCLAGAFITVAFWSTIFMAILSWQFALSPNSITFNMWKETPLPMYMNVVLFNWTNPLESLSGPEKPAFVEMGPYVFSEHHSKQNIHWNDGNSTITFLNRNEWHFMANMSTGSLSDLVTNLNTVAVTIGSQCHNAGNATISVDKILREKGKLIVTKTAGELIFDGYEDKLLQDAQIKQYIPDFPTYDKFGWYYQRNMSATFDGVITMYTGEKDIEKLGLLTGWNYLTRTGCYPDDCGKVQATIGNVLPLSTYKQNQFTLFNSDICGVYTLEYERSVELNAIPGIQYKATDSMFNNHQTCYCPRSACPPPGVRDISKCKHAPLFVSLPHFLHGDPSYLNAVSGLKPDPEKHSFFMSLANLTSVPLVVQVRLQTNLLLERFSDVGLFSNVTTNYIPMYWVDQYAVLTPNLAALMHPLYPFHSWGGWVIFILSGGMGATLLLVGIVFRCQDDNTHSHE